MYCIDRLHFLQPTFVQIIGKKKNMSLKSPKKISANILGKMRHLCSIYNMEDWLPFFPVFPQLKKFWDYNNQSVFDQTFAQFFESHPPPSNPSPPAHYWINSVAQVLFILVQILDKWCSSGSGQQMWHRVSFRTVKNF